VQRDIHRAVTAAHARVPGELPQRTEGAHDIQRIFARQVRFEYQRDALYARIPHLAQPVHILVV